MEEKFSVVMNAEWLGEQVAGIIYNQGKAKIFNLLEAQLPEGSQLWAYRRLAQDIIGGIAKDAKRFIEDILDDWEEEVELGGNVSPATEEEARREYEGLQEALR